MTRLQVRQNWTGLRCMSKSLDPCHSCPLNPCIWTNIPGPLTPKPMQPYVFPCPCVPAVYAHKPPTCPFCAPPPTQPTIPWPPPPGFPHHTHLLHHQWSLHPSTFVSSSFLSMFYFLESLACDLLFICRNVSLDQWRTVTSSVGMAGRWPHHHHIIGCI